MPSPPPPPGPPLVTVMGVSGSGKTTVGAALAQRLGVPFADADDFHPAANVAKMSAGVPLDDLDQPVDDLVVQAVEALTARGVAGTPSPSARPTGPASAGKEA